MEPLLPVLALQRYHGALVLLLVRQRFAAGVVQRQAIASGWPSARRNLHQML
jgi:hypothetical protein